MNKLYTFITTLFVVFNSFVLFAQVDNEFWFVIPEVTRQHYDGGGEPTYFRMASVGDTIRVIIEMPAKNTTLANIVIPAGQYAYYDITGLIRKSYITGSPTSGTYNDLNEIESGIPGTEGQVEDRGIHIYSQPYNSNNRNMDMTVYCDRFNTNNQDIFSLKGQNGLGINFTIPGQTTWPNHTFSSPEALNAFDIVATEDATTVKITPTQRIKKQTSPFYYEKNVTFEVDLNAGETFSCVAVDEAVSAHLGGSIVTANNEIAITLKDDSMEPPSSGAYDLGGDQLIPDSLGGKEFIVMRGELKTSDYGDEYAYVMAIKDGTTNVTHSGGSFSLSGRGAIKKIQMNGSPSYDALYIESDQKVLVWHVTGFGDETGAAIIPSIDLCTGSKDVTVVRSGSQRFFMVIMTQTAYINQFSVYIDVNGNNKYEATEKFTFPASSFTEVFDASGVSTGWWYLNKASNEFTSSSVFGQAIIAGRPTRITNTGRFHLGTIEGNTGQGCKYGYFSSFSADNSGASIGLEGNNIKTYCYGDTIELYATGGESYLWWYDGTPQSYNKFITDTTIDNPLALLTPVGSLQATYKVRIEKDCYDAATEDPIDTIAVDVQMYKKIEADFDTTLLTTCCSPTEYNVKHTNQTYTYQSWEIFREKDTLSYTDTIKSTATTFNKNFEFTNSSYGIKNYLIQHVVNQNHLCKDTVTKSIKVYPQITAKMVKGSKSGCQQYVTQKFAVDTAGAGPFEAAEWNWGDGTSVEYVLHADAADSISHTFTNLNEYDTTYYITLTLIDSTGGCNSSVADSVFVPGVARARFTIQNKKGCSPLTITVNNHTKGDVAYEWWWYTYDMTKTPNSTSDAATQTITYTNNSLLPDTNYVSMRITKLNDDGTYCYDTYGPDTIIVYPEFTTAISADKTVGCNPLTVDFSQTTTPDVATTYYWDFGDATTSGAKNPDPKIYEIFQPTDKTFTASLITESAYGCRDTAAPVSITVYSTVDASFTIDDTVGCSPLTLTLQNNTVSYSVTNFIWTLDGGTGTTSNTLPFNVTYTNFLTTPQTHTITLSNTNSHSCAYSYSKVITVNPEITIQYSPSSDTICHNTSITFDNTSYFTFDGSGTTPISGSTYTYYWDFGDGTSSSAENPVHTFKNTENNGTTPQKFTVSLTVTAFDCSETYTNYIYVYPKVTAQFEADRYYICSPELLELRSTSVGAATLVWRPNDTAGVVNNIKVYDHYFQNTISGGNTIQTTKVILRAVNDICKDSITKSFSVYPELVPTILPDKTSGCGPLDVTFTNSSTGAITLYEWDFDDGLSSNSTGVTHTFANQTSSDVPYVVQLKISNAVGCADSTTSTITVYPEVEANFAFVKDQKCTPFIATIENVSLNGTQYNWDFGDGSTDVTYDKDPIYHTYNTNTTNALITRYITLVAIDNNHTACKDSITKPIKEYPRVIADFTIAGNIGCSPLESQLTNISSGYELRYLWDYGDENTSSETSPQHDYTFRNLTEATLPYVIQLTAIDSLGCSNSTTDTVTVYPEVVANFTINRLDECTPFPVEFTYPTSALNGNKFMWDFGDGSDTVDYDKQTFTHIFDNSTPNTINTYTIQLYALDTTTKCDSTITKTIEVYPRLIPLFNPDTFEGCDPLTVTFTNYTTGLANYAWDFGDGESGTELSPTHEFSHLSSTDEIYNVVLNTKQNSTGCIKTADTEITVYSYVDAHFGLAKVDGSKAKSIKSGEIVGGCSPFTVEIMDSSKTDYTWSWDFGDGTTDSLEQPGNRIYYNTDSVEPLENSVYEVKLEVANVHGCTDRDSAKLQVYPRSIPDFDVENKGCHPHKVTFTNLTVDDDNTKYSWTLGDGSTKVIQDFSYTYNNYSYTDIKTYTVKLATSTMYGCEDETSQVITVYPKPLAEFIPEVDRACPPFQTSLSSATSEGTDLTYFWDFDNGVHPIRYEPTVETPTYYNNSSTDEIKELDPSLIVKTEYGCSDTIVVPIYVYPAVSAGFTPSIDEGCSPLTVQFTNTSNASAKLYTWTFGDGETSGLKEPKHIYYNESEDDEVYIVNLYTESDHGCSSELSDTISVYITPVVDFDATPPVQFYPSDTVTFTNLTQSGPWTYHWDYGNGDENYETAEEFIYKYYGWAPNEDDNIFWVTLSVYSDHCSGEKTKSVTIIPPVPEVEITKVSPGEGCMPLEVEFQLQQQYGEYYLWEFGNGDTSDDDNPTYTYEEAGIFNVKLTVTGDGGSWYDYTIVTVYALPEPDFKVSPDYVMLPDQEIHTYNLTLNGYTYEWFFGDGDTSTDENASHLYTETGVYDITLVAYTAEGCVDSITKYAAATVDGSGSIEFPNAFLPTPTSSSNGSFSIPDTDNKIFHPVFERVKDYELWIFNRWGEQVFYSDDVYVGWNGKYGNNGKELGQDVYFWKSIGEFENGKPFKLSGDVTLIRRGDQ